METPTFDPAREKLENARLVRETHRPVPVVQVSYIDMCSVSLAQLTTIVRANIHDNIGALQVTKCSQDTKNFVWKWGLGKHAHTQGQNMHR